jgi:hypothetical protein
MGAQLRRAILIYRTSLRSGTDRMALPLGTFSSPPNHNLYRNLNLNSRS